MFSPSRRRLRPPLPLSMDQSSDSSPRSVQKNQVAPWTTGGASCLVKPVPPIHSQRPFSQCLSILPLPFLLRFLDHFRHSFPSPPIPSTLPSAYVYISRWTPKAALVPSSVRLYSCSICDEQHLIPPLATSAPCLADLAQSRSAIRSFPRA